MTHTIERRFARDPFAAVAALHEDRLGCLLCSNSRADQWRAYCLPANNIGKPVSRVPFPHSGPGCPCFEPRPEPT